MKFYKTTVETKTPLEAMKDIELPPNMHILYEPHRFNPGKYLWFNLKSNE